MATTTEDSLEDVIEMVLTMCNPSLITELQSELDGWGREDVGQLIAMVPGHLSCRKFTELATAIRPVISNLWEICVDPERKSKSPGLSESVIILLTVLGLSDSILSHDVTCYQSIDRAYILGMPHELYHALCDLISKYVAEKSTSQQSDTPAENSKASKFPDLTFNLGESCPTENKVPRGLKLRTGEFEKNYFDKGIPVIITEIASRWVALTAWPTLERFATDVGERTVPIELGIHDGGKRGDLDAWKETTCTLKEFCDVHLASSLKTDVQLTNADATESSIWEACRALQPLPVYMAQHELFRQFPELDADIRPYPRYCRVQGRQVERVNVWMGTKGTVTPCHTDSYENILVQVAGWKVVRLYPSDQENMYPGRQGDSKESSQEQENISRVDVEDPDLKTFPLFPVEKVQIALLGPGDALYIPQGWWHHVRSLSTSISVNFWF
eukprot:m.345220 g.345220  ORF g.345220 m.345220 type:complete len:443 (-) comp25924_c0_seq1:22-1350(-)